MPCRSMLGIVVVGLGLLSTGCASTAIQMSRAESPVGLRGDEAPTRPWRSYSPPAGAESLEPGQVYEVGVVPCCEGVASTVTGEFVRYEEIEPDEPIAIFRNATLQGRPVAMAASAETETASVPSEDPSEGDEIGETKVLVRGMLSVKPISEGNGSAVATHPGSAPEDIAASLNTVKPRTAARIGTAASPPPVAAEAMQPGRNYKAIQRSNSEALPTTLHGVFARYDYSDPKRPQAVFHNAIREHTHVRNDFVPPILRKVPHVSRLFKTNGLRLEPACDLEPGESLVPLSELHQIEYVRSRDALHATVREIAEGGNTRSTVLEIRRGDEVLWERIGIDFNDEVAAEE